MISCYSTISAIGLNKKLQYRMICLIECLDQVEMLFLCDLSVVRKVPSTQVNKVIDVPDSPTGHGEERKDFRRQQTQMETGHQMFRIRDRTADRVRGIKQRDFALLSECAVQTRSIALLRVRGYPEDTSRGWNKQGSRTAQSARRRPAQHNARCNAGWRGMTQRFSKLGQPKRQLLNRFCDHHELLDYTSRFVHG